MVRWDTLFMEQYPAQGAGEPEIQSVTGSLFLPLSDAEVSAVNSAQSNPFPASDPLHSSYRPFDARNWRLPVGPLPESYLDFLRWSNGGSFLNGERRFDPFLPVSKLRETLLSYQFPQYMPGAVPFALNGGGCFYVFDMRPKPTDGEFPILFVGAGNLGYDEAVRVGDSFAEVCKGSTNPAYYGLE